MLNIGDIVTFCDNNMDVYYMGVIMETTDDTVIVQDSDEKQYDLPFNKVKRATPEDMMEELRSIYGFYH